MTQPGVPPPSERPESEGVDPRLERRLSREMRAHLAEAEREAELLAARRRNLAQVAWGAVERGDTITVSAGGMELTGVGIYARGDLLTLRTPHVLGEVNLNAVDWIRIDQPAVSGGVSSPVEAASFVARLGLLELSGERVEVVGRGGRPRVGGELVAVARDHLCLQGPDHKQWFLVFDRIAYVLRPLPL